MVCTSLGSQLRPLFYFLCYIHFSLSVYLGLNFQCQNVYDEPVFLFMYKICVICVPLSKSKLKHESNVRRAYTLSAPRMSTT